MSRDPDRNYTRQVKMRNAPTHSIVRVDGRWGVIVHTIGNRPGNRVVDFWDGGRERIDPDHVVSMLVERT